MTSADNDTSIPTSPRIHHVIILNASCLHPTCIMMSPCMHHCEMVENKGWAIRFWLMLLSKPIITCVHVVVKTHKVHRHMWGYYVHCDISIPKLIVNDTQGMKLLMVGLVKLDFRLNCYSNCKGLLNRFIIMMMSINHKYFVQMSATGYRCF